MVTSCGPLDAAGVQSLAMLSGPDGVGRPTSAGPQVHHSCFNSWMDSFQHGSSCTFKSILADADAHAPCRTMTSQAAPANIFPSSIIIC